MLSGRTKIALVDDHRMFLDGLGTVVGALDPAYVCTSFASPRELLARIEAKDSYNLIITDLVMEEMNGIAFIVALQARRCATPVLVVSGIDTLPPVEKVLSAGARGFVPKSASTEMLGRAIRTVLAGEIFLPADLWAVMEENSSSPRTVDANTDERGDADPLLGPRQMDVLRLVAEGYSNRRISEVLGISENTAKTHIKHIFRQLNVSRRTACVSKARSIGLID